MKIAMKMGVAATAFAVAASGVCAFSDEAHAGAAAALSEYCRQSSAAVKAEVVKSLMESGCLVGAERARSDVRICRTVKVAQTPDPAKGASIIPDGDASLVCGTCEKEDPGTCTTDSTMQASFDLRVNADEVLAGGTGSVHVVVNGSVSWGANSYPVDSVVPNPDATGVQKATNVTTAIIAPKWKYTGGIVVGISATAKSALQTAGLNIDVALSCSQNEQVDTWATAVGVGNNVCGDATLNRTNFNPLTGCMVDAGAPDASGRTATGGGSSSGGSASSSSGGPSGG